MATANTPESRNREATYVAIACLPLVILAGALVVGLSREWIASMQNRNTVAALKASGAPVDAADFYAAELGRQATARNAQLQRLERASDYVTSKYNEVFSKINTTNELVPSDQPLDYIEIYQRFRRDAEPILEELEVADRDPTRNSRHVNFGHNAGNLLSRDFVYAYHQGDSERALRLLKLSSGIGDTILASLAHHFWDAEELAQLRLMVTESIEWDGKWASSIDVARLSLLAGTDGIQWSRRNYRDDSFLTDFGMVPTQVKSRLSMFDQAKSLRGLGSRQAYLAAKEIVENCETFSLVSVPMATATFVGNNYSNRIDENANRYALSAMEKRRIVTAIAIKQFQLQENHFPASLNELTKVGLTSPDWKIIDDHDFGYRVTEGGQAAVLWSAGTSSYRDPIMWYDEEFQTPGEPPSVTHTNTQHIKETMSTIR